jgi:hypothetical protein
MSHSTAVLLGILLRRWAGGYDDPPADTTVPVTARGQTADGADVRLLIEAQVRAVPGSGTAAPERIVLALLAPAARRWLRGRELALVESDLAAARIDLDELVGPELADLGIELLRIDVVGAEHLLRSSSGDPSTGGPDGPG